MDLVDREKTVSYIKALQNEDGSFSGDISGKAVSIEDEVKVH